MEAEITAVFRPRHLETLRPEAFAFIGKRLSLARGFTFGDGEGIYAKQTAWMPTEVELGWIPDEDLEARRSTAPDDTATEPDTQPRDPGCQCDKEIGDSPCRVHGDEGAAAEPGKPATCTCADDFGPMAPCVPPCPNAKARP